MIIPRFSARFNLTLLLALAFLFGGIAAAHAAGAACYSPAEESAEQLLRLHSQLMVITVTCRTDSQGNNLVPAYTGFTKTNLPALHEAEQTLIRFYKVHFGGNGLSRLDDLRTKLGNEYGQEIADISAPLFCGKYRDKPIRMVSATPQQIDANVQDLIVGGKSYGHACAADQRTAQLNH